MLAVIADDLTGAAELGGIGLKYGLQVEIATEVSASTEADLLVISTDSRSISEQEAIDRVTQVCRAIWAMQPKIIYKKTDSVLRGHVVAETRAQMHITGQQKALIVAANPYLGRTLKNGHYYFNNVLIHQTYFSQDPEFPILDANVLSMVRADATQVSVRTAQEGVPDKGIVIGEVAEQADLQAWTKWIADDTLLGGAAGFFTAVMDALLPKPKAMAMQTQPLSNSRLYVCGTAFGKSVERIRQAQREGKAVSYMPGTLIESGTTDDPALERWATEVAELLKTHQQVIIAIDPDTVNPNKANAIWLRTAMATGVKRMLVLTPADELIIEGGSTASAVLRALGVARLIPVQELGHGVVRSQAVEQPSLYITVKPGSYAWANGLWIS